jgi:hypothetical protein
MRSLLSLFMFVALLFAISSCDQTAVNQEATVKTDTLITNVVESVTVPKAKLYDEIILKNGKQKVTIDNFIRAETDHYFKLKADLDCFGKLCHDREPANVDKQTIIRLNRDTRYSSAIFDLNSPLTIVKPDTKGRFQSMVVINEDHFIKKVAYDPGEYVFTKENIGTRYVQIVFRTLVDPASAEDNKIVDQLQDAIIVKQDDRGKLELPDWDETTLSSTRNGILALGREVPNNKGMFGDVQEVDPIRHLIGTAGGYGGNAEKDAMYLNLNPPQNDGKTAYTLLLKDVPVDAFWSVSVYNEKGYFEKNAHNSYSLNSITAQKNADGSATLRFGGDPKQPNFLNIMKGWNYTVRLYRPRKEVLEGSWKLPELMPAK